MTRFIALCALTISCPALAGEIRLYDQLVLPGFSVNYSGRTTNDGVTVVDFYLNTERDAVTAVSGNMYREYDPDGTRPNDVVITFNVDGIRNAGLPIAEYFQSGNISRDGYDLYRYSGAYNSYDWNGNEQGDWNGTIVYGGLDFFPFVLRSGDLRYDEFTWDSTNYFGLQVTFHGTLLAGNPPLGVFMQKNLSVPEPASIISMLIGAASFVGAFLKKRLV